MVHLQVLSNRRASIFCNTGHVSYSVHVVLMGFSSKDHRQLMEMAILQMASCEAK